MKAFDFSLGWLSTSVVLENFLAGDDPFLHRGTHHGAPQHGDRRVLPIKPRQETSAFVSGGSTGADESAGLV